LRFADDAPVGRKLHGEIQNAKVEGLRRDVAQFFALPITREVWGKIKVLQNDEFVAFVESCQNWK